MLLQLTAGLVDRGHDVMTIVGEEGWLVDRLGLGGYVVETLAMTGGMGIARVPTLARRARRHGIDVILSHGARVNLFGAMAAALAGVPSVSVEHSMDDWRTGGGIYARLDRIVARANRGRIAVSRAVGDMLVEHGVLPAERVEVVPNGVVFPPEGALADRAGVRKRLGFGESETVLVVVARLAKPKGHAFLFESLAGMRMDQPELRCLLLGDGPLRGELERQVSELGLADVVVFGGAVDDVLDILPACDLFVLPSLWEGLPVAAIEAMGMGLPVIATRVAGTPEVVRHEETGLLVEPADPHDLAKAIGRLLADDALRNRLAAAGKRSARERYSFHEVLDRYEDVLMRWVRG